MRYSKVSLLPLDIYIISLSFFKCELHYIRHLILGTGINPLHEKLKSIEDLLVPKIHKEVRHMLGLISYLCKFTPTYAYLIKPLTKLICKIVPFISVTVYQDLTIPYSLFTGCSKYAWSTVFTLEYATSIDGKIVSHQHQITNVSGLF